MLAGRVRRHGMLPTRFGIVGFLMGQHGPPLPRMFMGDGHQELAVRHPARQLLDPELLGGCSVYGSHLGTPQTTARTQDQ